MAEPKDPDGSLPGFDRYIRRMYGQAWFPKLDKNGMVYLPGMPGARGRQAQNNMKYLGSEHVLDRHFQQHFPQRAVHTVTDPEFRATIHKAGGQQTLFGNSLSKFSSAAALKKAASEFEIPSNTRILIAMLVVHLRVSVSYGNKVSNTVI